MACEIRRRKIDGAINFTASHNPAEYHGLKFSAADGGPALPEVTHDIEARAARLYARTAERKASAFPSPHDAAAFEQVDIAPPYLAQLAELVRFSELKTKTAPHIVYDALHGCGAGYLDRALAEHGVCGCETIRAQRDVLFEGSGPDVSESNLKLLSETVIAHKAHKSKIGLATDGDADRFGIVDADGTWISPNHILGLLYDYLIESRGWKLDAARSVATSHLLDAVAAKHGRKVHETPVGFKYIGQLILKDAIALGGEESAGLSIRGHVPEKDGILACLLVAEMVAARQAPARRTIARALSPRGPRILAAAHESASAGGRQDSRRGAAQERFLGVPRPPRRARRSHRRAQAHFRRRLLDFAAPLRHRAPDAHLYGNTLAGGIRAARRRGSRLGLCRRSRRI